MKRPFFFLLVLFLYSASFAWDGTGTEDDPYLIKCVNDMVTLSANVNGGAYYSGKYFKVDVEELDFSSLDKDDNGSNFTPIGNHFSGFFDGNHVLVKNLAIKGGQGVGLFKAVNSGSKVMNIAITATCEFSGTSYVGCIAARANEGSTISGCVNQCDVDVEGNYVGGIVGYGLGTVIGCSNSGTITGNEYVGGIVGSAGGTYKDNVNTGAVRGSKCVGGIIGYIINSWYFSYADNCSNEGVVTGTDEYTGGIVGRARLLNANDCVNTGEVFGQYKTGGIVGSNEPYNDETMNFNTCRNEGTVSGSIYVGGIAGTDKYGYFDDCSNSGIIYGTGEAVGGIVGNVDNYNHITNSSNTGNVSGLSNYVGGVVGRGNNYVSASTNSGAITGNDGVGGIAGYGKNVEGCVNSGIITGIGENVTSLVGYGLGGIAGCGTANRCTNHGTVTGNDSNNSIGGIIGNGTATDCTNKANITAITNSYAGLYYVGGVVGKGSATNCSNEGELTGKIRYAGGIVGYNTSSVSGCTNMGDITADGQEHGGIVGYNKNFSVSNCTNMGNITANGRFHGGIAGYNEGTIDNCSNSGEVGVISMGSAQNGDTGGIAGYSVGSVSNCLNEGSVKGNSGVGAIIGWNNKGSLSENYYCQDVLVRILKSEYDSECVYGGKTPRGCGASVPYDVTENNGALLIDINVTPNKGMTTYTSKFKLDFTKPINGLKAYVVSSVTNGKAELTEVTGKVPAGTGLILKGTVEQNYAIPYAIGEVGVVTNKLEGVLNDTEIGGNDLDYILKDGKFVKASAGMLSAGKAYLKLDAALARGVVEIDGDATGVGAVLTNSEERIVKSEVYNLQGQRISQPAKGLYVVDGKKVFVK